MTEHEQDHYEALQVLPTADPEVIEAAYTRLASKYDPAVDGSTEAAECVLRLNAAFEVLSDPLLRAEYDEALARAAERDIATLASETDADYLVAPSGKPLPRRQLRELPAIDPAMNTAERAFPLIWAGMLAIVCIIGIVRAWQHLP